MSEPKVDHSEVAQAQEHEGLEPALKQHPSGDVALALVDTSVATEITAEEERATARRIDMVLVPVMFITFGLQYMDKACLTGAALFGILIDLKLVQV